MKFISIATASFIAVGSLITATPAEAFNGRNAAVAECNDRVRRGFVANNQAAFNHCVEQQEAFLAPVTNSPGARGYCDGVKEGIIEGGDSLDSAFGRFALQMSGC